MPIKPLPKLNIYMRPAQKAALQLAAAQAGISVSALGRGIVDAALANAGKSQQSPDRQPENLKTILPTGE